MEPATLSLAFQGKGSRTNSASGKLLIASIRKLQKLTLLIREEKAGRRAGIKKRHDAIRPVSEEISPRASLLYTRIYFLISKMGTETPDPSSFGKVPVDEKWVILDYVVNYCTVCCPAVASVVSAS